MKITITPKTIERLFNKYKINYKVMNNGEYAVNSPFVHDTTFDCRINLEKQCFNDFESGESGRIQKILATLIDIDESEMFSTLLGLGVQNIDDDIPRIILPQRTKVKEIQFPLSYSFEKDSGNEYPSTKKQAIYFIANKMCNYEIAKKYNLRWTETLYYNNLSDAKKINFSKRIIIPTFENEKFVYFQARSFINSKMRYKNISKDIQPKNIVLPFYDHIEEGKDLFISEGPWEAMQYGGTYMLGSTLSDIQVSKIKRKNPKKIYIIPDNDQAGRNTIIKNIKKLKEQLSAKIYIIYWWIDENILYKDPIDAGITKSDIYKYEAVPADKNFLLKMQLESV